jgi:hypothetical protein
MGEQQSCSAVAAVSAAAVSDCLHTCCMFSSLSFCSASRRRLFSACMSRRGAAAKATTIAEQQPCVRPASLNTKDGFCCG